MIYGVDIDGILCDLDGAMLRDINARHGTAFGPDHVVTWDWRSNPHLSLYTDFVWSELYPDETWHLSCQPVDGAIAGLARLEAAGRCHLITARALDHLFVTIDWLDKHNLAIHSDVVVNRDKAQACKQLSVDVMLEDGPHNAESLAAAGVPVILFDRAYNRHVSHELITRVSGWTEALERLGLS